MRIGILIGSIQPKGLEVGSNLDTPYGSPSSPLYLLKYDRSTFYFLSRHALPPRIPPHRVNHRANVWAMKEAGVERVISICSTGALSADIKVPSFAVPEDYIDLSPLLSFYDDTIKHVTPSLDREMGKALMRSFRKMNVNCNEGGVYVQTSGPRLETKAEVRMISGWGDYVGMNLASEATLCNELDIPVAGLISIDNYANGIMDSDPDYKDILAQARTNWNTIKKVLELLSFDP